MTAPRLSRRGLLAGSAAALVTAACSGSPSSTPAPSPTTAPTTAPPGDQPTGDLAFAALAAAIENLLAATYQSVLDQAAGEKLGAVPVSVTTWVKTTQSHHRDHAAAWNAMLTGAGSRVVTGVDSTLDASVAKPGLASLRSATDALELAAQLEQVAAATYLAAVERTLTTAAAVQTAIAVQPVEMQHVAVINLFTAVTPVPSSFASASGARTVGDAIA